MCMMHANDKAALIEEAKALRARADKIAARVRSRDTGIPTQFEMRAVLDLVKQAFKLEQEASKL